MKRKQNAGRLLGALLVALSSLVNASETKFVQYDESAMRQLKHTVAAASSAEVTKLAYQRLLITADAFLSRPEPSVMEKTFTPPSGNKHDYLSIGQTHLKQMDCHGSEKTVLPTPVPKPTTLIVIA